MKGLVAVWPHTQRVLRERNNRKLGTNLSQAEKNSRTLGGRSQRQENAQLTEKRAACLLPARRQRQFRGCGQAAKSAKTSSAMT